LGVREGGYELLLELVPGISHIVCRSHGVQPVSYLSRPFLDKRSLYQGECKGDSGEVGLEGGDLVVQSEVRFELVEELFG
jgi:hypothetical protein